ncbi:hypothetical protein C2E25_09760 [Geothermobacter hydrogeniphilus]|uniref:Uncharacterized protein n=1 Tax=Geothermobacter hydrogeniphilus TaxID=1969733 RepID=A0A2K2H9K5_9BACT|nr:hypothetical protein C2E25_09760 [Geothermobacter hydrogeniphilus]
MSVAVVLLLSAACTTPLPPPELPAGVDLRLLGRSPGAMLLRWSPDGRLLAVAGNGLDIYEPAGSIRRHLLDEQVSAIVWTSDSRTLLVAVGTAMNSRLETWSRDGRKLSDRDLEGYAADLLRTKNGLLLIEGRLKNYRFGSNLRVVLMEISARGEGPARVLYENTLPPDTATWLAQHPRALSGAVLNPTGDMMAYLQFRDPPAFPPAQQLMVRHLPSRRQWSVAALSPPTGRPVFTPDGERLLVVDGKGRLLSLDIWDGQAEPVPNGPGRAVAIARTGNASLLAGRLSVAGNATGVAAKVEVAAFDPAGRQLAWLRSSQLEVLAVAAGKESRSGFGLPTERLESLHDWRARGLIDADDYRTQRRRMMNQ